MDEETARMMPVIDSSRPTLRDDPHQRAAGDPLGLRGLPESRGELDEKLRDLCRTLIYARGEFLTGPWIVRRIGLRDTRALRLLVAYGRVHHRIRQVIALPGAGYCWGEYRPDLYDSCASQARRMGLCHLFIAGLLKRRPPAVEFAQLALDFVRESGKRPDHTVPADELAVWMSAEDLTAADVLDAMIQAFGATDEGRAALAQAGRKHAAMLLPPETRRRIAEHLAAAQQAINDLPTAG